MKTEQLTMAFGIQAAARLMVLKSKFDATPELADHEIIEAPEGECPCCGEIVKEGAMH